MNRAKLFATFCVLLLTLNSCFVSGGLLEQRFARRTRGAKGIPNEFPGQQQGIGNNPKGPGKWGGGVRDGMSDIIWFLLGVTTGVFLEIISYNLHLVEGRMEESQAKIQEGIGNGDPAIDTQLRALNETIQSIITQHIKPLQRDLDLVLPSLTRQEAVAAKAGVMPLDANDIIEALLGMTLAEFIQKIYGVVSTSDENLNTYIISLGEAAERVTDPDLRNILVWLVNKLTESRRGLQPHLTNLRRILGEEPQSQ